MALEIYYTGPEEAGGTQKVASKSLGGFVSSSIMPNDSFGNLFGEISQMSLENQPRTARVLAVRNAGSDPVTGLKVYTECDEASDVSYQLGYQPLEDNLNDCADLCSEKLPNENAIPHKITMDEAEGSPNALSLPDLDAGQYLFLYITRQIESSVQDYSYSDLLSLEESPLANSQTDELVFSYD